MVRSKCPSAGRFRRPRTVGDCFGEIALLREVAAHRDGDRADRRGVAQRSSARTSSRRSPATGARWPRGMTSSRRGLAGRVVVELTPEHDAGDRLSGRRPARGPAQRPGDPGAAARDGSRDGGADRGPAAGRSAEVGAVLERLERDVLPYMNRADHPRFFAFIPGVPARSPAPSATSSLARSTSSPVPGWGPRDGASWS